MNKALAQKAIEDLHADHITNTTRGLCAGWAREVVTDEHGKAVANPKGLDAWNAFKWYQQRGLSVAPEHGSVIGDILFKKATVFNPHGHVGIRIAGNRVAENSSVHARDDEDARGIRTLSQFGRVDGIIRIPAKEN